MRRMVDVVALALAHVVLVTQKTQAHNHSGQAQNAVQTYFAHRADENAGKNHRLHRTRRTQTAVASIEPVPKKTGYRRHHHAAKIQKQV